MLGRYPISQDVTFFESSPFFASPSPSTSEMDSMEDFLIYTVNYLTPTASFDPPRPPITHVHPS